MWGESIVGNHIITESCYPILSVLYTITPSTCRYNLQYYIEKNTGIYPTFYGHYTLLESNPDAGTSLSLIPILRTNTSSECNPPNRPNLADPSVMTCTVDSFSLLPGALLSRLVRSSPSILSAVIPGGRGQSTGHTSYCLS